MLLYLYVCKLYKCSPFTVAIAPHRYRVFSMNLYNTVRMNPKQGDITEGFTVFLKCIQNNFKGNVDFPQPISLFAIFTGAGPDGVEDIKRHSFFSTIDWNVSLSISYLFVFLFFFYTILILKLCILFVLCLFSPLSPFTEIVQERTSPPL